MRVLVTGGNGFIGSNLVNLLLENKLEVVILVLPGEILNPRIIDSEKLQILVGNLDDLVKLDKQIPDKSIDSCIHLAWEGSTGNARGDVNIQISNIIRTTNLIKLLSIKHINKFIGSGSLAEKDVLNYHFDDGSNPNAVSNYGVAKLSTYLFSKVECNKYGIEHIWCYLGNTYGVGNTNNNFINFAIKLLLEGKRASFTDGLQVYDFVYISDTASAIFNVLKHGVKNHSYYLGSGKPRLLREYIVDLRDIINPNIKLYFGEIPFNGNSLEYKDYEISKLTKDTKSIDEVDFITGIKKTVEWIEKEYRYND